MLTLKRIAFAGVVLLVAAFASAQTATPGQSLAWSHPTAVAELVTHFEVKYDAGSYVNAGITPHPTLTATYYQPIPALVTGPHTVVVRACNAAGCSADLAFSFSMVAGVPTALAPGSILIIQTP